MRRRLVLLRHGRTEWNLAGRGQGQRDIPLDDVGRAQAAAAGAAVARLEPLVVFSSDFSRAHDTAVAIGAPVQLDHRFREIDLGVHEGQLMADWKREDPSGYRRWRAGEDIRAGSGESYVEVGRRVLPALADAWSVWDDAADALARAQVTGEGAGTAEPGPLVIVSHGGAIRALLTGILDLPPAAGARLGGLGNCCCAVLDDAGDTRGLRLLFYGIPPQAIIAAAEA